MKNNHLPPVLAKATGEIEFTLKNDMLFHMVMARSNLALKGLVCALKGLQSDDVHSVVLMNPIDYNEYLEKEIILDVKVEMNSREVLDIELQIANDLNWVNRSLLYLCRAFDHLKSGEDYDKLKPTTHIGIMDYDLFPEEPEFYAKYLLKNIRTGTVYSPNLALNVLSLNQTEFATDEDRKNGLVYWAEVFRATTWEQLKSLADGDAALTEVMEKMYTANADVKQQSLLRAQQKAREVRLSLEGTVRRQKDEINTLLAERDEVTAERDEITAERDKTIEALQDAQKEIERLRAQLAVQGEE